MMDIPVFYADDEAKRLYIENPILKEKIISTFGNEIYPNNLFDKVALKNMVFSDKNLLAKLNSIVHPLVKNHYAEWEKRQKSLYTIKEAALLIEAGTYKDLDVLVVVTSPNDIRIDRICERDHLSKEEAKKRIELQMPDKEKVELADYIITNDEEHLIIPQVSSLHRRFVQLSLGN